MKISQVLLNVFFLFLSTTLIDSNASRSPASDADRRLAAATTHTVPYDESLAPQATEAAKDAVQDAAKPVEGKISRGEKREDCADCEVKNEEEKISPLAKLIRDLKKSITGADSTDIENRWQDLEDFLSIHPDQIALVEELKLELMQKLADSIENKRDIKRVLNKLIKYAKTSTNSDDLKINIMSIFYDKITDLQSSELVGLADYDILIEAVDNAREADLVDEDLDDQLADLRDALKQEQRERTNADISRLQQQMSENCMASAGPVDHKDKEARKERRSKTKLCREAKSELRVAQKVQKKFMKEQQKELQRQYARTQAMAYQAQIAMQTGYMYNPYMYNSNFMYNPYSMYNYSPMYSPMYNSYPSYNQGYAYNPQF